VLERLLRIKMPAADGANRHAALFGSLQGGFGCLAPLWEGPAAARLEALGTAMATGVPHAAGLNPRSFRTRHARIHRALGGGDSRFKPSAEGCVLDGDLLMAFPRLARREQDALAAAARAARGQLLADLREVAAALALL
jgi:cleavage and polyadenylation specificity factor subunit 1